MQGRMAGRLAARTARASAFFALALLLGGLGPLGTLAPAPAAAQESLRAVLEEIHAADPSLSISRQRIEEANYGVSRARQALRPQVSATAGFSRARERDPQSGDSVYSTPRNIGLEYSQVLPFADRYDAVVDSAKEDVYAARQDLLAAEQALLLQGVRGYFALWRAQETLALAREAEELSGRELAIAERRAELGEATRTDVALARSNLASASSERIQAEGGLEGAQVALARLMGRLPAAVAAPPPLALPPGEEGAEAAVLVGGHPSLQAQRHRMESTFNLIRQARGGTTPELTVQGGITSRTISDIPDFNDSSVTLGLRVTAPLVAKGVSSDAYHARLAAYRRLAREERRIRLDLEQSAVAARARRAAAAERIGALNVAVAAAEEALEAVREENRVGLRSQSDLIAAESSLVRSKTALVGAEHDRRLAAYV